MSGQENTNAVALATLIFSFFCFFLKLCFSAPVPLPDVPAWPAGGSVFTNEDHEAHERGSYAGFHGVFRRFRRWAQINSRYWSPALHSCSSLGSTLIRPPATFSLQREKGSTVPGALGQAGDLFNDEGHDGHEGGNRHGFHGFFYLRFLSILMICVNLRPISYDPCPAWPSASKAVSPLCSVTVLQRKKEAGQCCPAPGVCSLFG